MGRQVRGRGLIPIRNEIGGCRRGGGTGLCPMFRGLGGGVLKCVKGSKGKTGCTLGVLWIAPKRSAAWKQRESWAA